MFEHASFRYDPILEPVVPDDVATIGDLPPLSPEEYIADRLNVIWESYGFQEHIDSLAQFIGTDTVLSTKFPLVSTKISNYDNDPSYHIPGLVEIGARVKSVESTKKIRGTDIKGIKGATVFYRTKHGEGTSEYFHESGFFCLILATIGESGLPILELTYGDLDRAEWQGEALKLKTIEYLSGRATDLDRLMYSPKMTVKFGAAILDLEVVSKQRFRKQKLPAVLRQNGEILTDTPDSTDNFLQIQAVRKKMQQFIDEHFIPGHIHLADSPLKMAGDKTCRPVPGPGFEFDQEHWYYMQRLELGEPPLLRVISEEVFTDFEQNQARRMIGVLFRDLPPEQLEHTLQRSQLTDDELRKIHSLQEKVYQCSHFDQMLGKTVVTPFVTSNWKRILERHPSMYPGITLQTLIDEYAAKKAKQ